MPSSRPRGWMILAVGLLLVACGPAGGESSTTGAGAANPTAAPSSPSAFVTNARGSIEATSTVTERTGTATRATTRTPAPCDNAALAVLVARFLDAYNAGDGARLLAFFPARDATRGIGIAGEETYFQRYWDSRKPRGRDGSGFEAYARDDLLCRSAGYGTQARSPSFRGTRLGPRASPLSGCFPFAEAVGVRLTTPPNSGK